MRLLLQESSGIWSKNIFPHQVEKMYIEFLICVGRHSWRLLILKNLQQSSTNKVSQICFYIKRSVFMSSFRNRILAIIS